MVYYNLKNWVYINLINPFKTMKKIKGVFKPLKCYFKIGKIPTRWCSNPSYITIVSKDVEWKDKWDSPRYENYPFIWIHIFNINLLWYWELPLHLNKDIDQYWEQALWYLYYYTTLSYGRLDKPDIRRAKESWPWVEYKTNISTWKDQFLIK
jgi:hypothetical protein